MQDRNEKRRWAFGIGSLLALTAGVALGFAVATSENGAIEQAFLPPIVVWIALSLVRQAWRLWSGPRSARDATSKENRWGQRLEIGWRIAAAAILVATLAVSVLRLQGVIVEPGREMWLLRPEILEFGIQLMTLAFVVTSGSWMRIDREASGWKRAVRVLVNAVSCLAIGALFFMTLANAGSIWATTRISVVGIELGQNRWHLPLASKARIASGEATFLWLATGAAALASANLIVLPRVFTEYYRDKSWKAWMTPLLLSLALTIAFPIWARQYGYGLVAAAFGEAESPSGRLIWVEMSFAVAIAAFAFLYGVLRRTSAHQSMANDSQSEAAGNRASLVSFHESRWAAGLLLIALAIPPLAVAYRMSTTVFFDFSTTVGLVLGGLDPDSQFRMAAFAASVGALFRWRASSRRISTQPPIDIPVGRFFFLWILATAALFSALACLAIFGFAIWLSPLMR